MLVADITGNIASVKRGLGEFRADQVPFAISLGLNYLARGVAEVEQDEIERTFDKPTPFTRNAYRIQVATKSRPIAVVAAKDIQAQYLAPYVNGGERFLGTKKAMLAPRAIKTNQYGNLPRAKLAQLKAKPGVFIGAVRTRGGKTVNGVWQRPTAGSRRGSARGGLKLLIQFEDTTTVPKHLRFYERARAYLDRNTQSAFDAAMRQALATSRR